MSSSKSAIPMSFKQRLIALFLLVFRGTIVHRVLRIIYYEGFWTFFKKSYGFVVQEIKFRLGLTYNPPFEAETMIFDLPESLPKFSIIGVLYNKEKELGFFLDAFFQQTYKGEFEIILVDDCSPDNGLALVETYKNKLSQIDNLKNRAQIKVVKNTENIGNCFSRLAGIKHATGDIAVIIDADCVVNRDYLKAHAEAYKNGDCDAAIGPMNIETMRENPLQLRNRLEKDFYQAFRKMEIQDEINGRSFLNCITRNFSIKKTFITEDLFDGDFSYSKKKDSGFGWEDVEMGYRLYKRGARIKFLNKSFSLHVTHPPSVGSEELKVAKSLKNFRRLFDKHPELILVARRWSLETYDKLSIWLKNSGAPENEDKNALDHHFKPHLRYALPTRRKDNLRVLTYRWHVPHQYELYKLPHKFTLATGIVNNFTKEWAFDQRPMPANARFVPVQKIREKDYDLAIIHFDENVLDWQNTNNVLDQSWGANFKYFMEEVSLPKVAICHGTPQFYGQYNNPNVDPSIALKTIEESRARLVDYLKDTQVICNSYQAQAEWQFKKSQVIWQGFDPTEYQPAKFNKGILSLGKAMKERPHYRGYDVFQKVFEGIPEEWHPQHFKVEEPPYEKNTNRYANAKYTNYIDAVRDYSIYFNPTIRSPMPRSRGEAMMCGLTSVSLLNHDVDLFIKNGVNGFYSSNPEELREYLLYLLRNPEMNKKIGLEGRKTSMDVFNHDRYLNAWSNLIANL